MIDIESRLEKEDYELFVELAKHRGQSKAALVRQCILAELSRSKIRSRVAPSESVVEAIADKVVVVLRRRGETVGRVSSDTIKGVV